VAMAAIFQFCPDGVSLPPPRLVAGSGRPSKILERWFAEIESSGLPSATRVAIPFVVNQFVAEFVRTRHIHEWDCRRSPGTVVTRRLAATRASAPRQ